MRSASAASVAGEDFHRDVTRKPRVARAIDLAHGAGVEWSHDPIRSEFKPLVPMLRQRRRPRGLWPSASAAITGISANPSASACAARSDSTSSLSAASSRQVALRKEPTFLRRACERRVEDVFPRAPSSGLRHDRVFGPS